MRDGVAFLRLETKKGAQDRRAAIATLGAGWWSLGTDGRQQNGPLGYYRGALAFGAGAGSGAPQDGDGKQMIEASAGVDAAPALPNLIFGVLALLGGIAMVVFRARLYGLTVRGQNRAFGKRAGAAVARRQSPLWVGVVGVFSALMGAAMVCYAIWRFTG